MCYSSSPTLGKQFHLSLACVYVCVQCIWVHDVRMCVCIWHGRLDVGELHACADEDGYIHAHLETCVRFSLPDTICSLGRV